MKTTILKPYECPGCNITNDAHASPDDYTPREGDISICFYCGYLGKFDEDMLVSGLTAEEIKALQEENPETYKEVIRIKSKIIAMRDESKNSIL